MQRGGTTVGPVASEAAAIAARLEHWGRARDWRGTDPYDGLNARRFAAPFVRSRRGRQALTQLVKRSPLDLRPLLGIAPERSAAGLALVVSAYARGVVPDAHAELPHALELLLAMRCDGFNEPCWGYEFDVQTKFFFYARGEPNTIATSFAGNALLDAYERTRDTELLELAVSTGDFFLRHVPQTEASAGAYFGYLVGDRTPIHNANMLVCALLARLHGETDRLDFRDAAAAGVAYTLSHQRRDGAWRYSEDGHGDWVDGYHTGYVLDSLQTCCAAGIPGASDDAYLRGFAYYARELFLEDGTPRYYDTSTYPVDIQSAAQGIQTAALAGQLDLARRVFGYTRRRLVRSDGGVVFQRRRLWTNRASHVRWGVAPMLLALAHLIAAERDA